LSSRISTRSKAKSQPAGPQRLTQGRWELGESDARPAHCAAPGPDRAGLVWSGQRRVRRAAGFTVGCRRARKRRLVESAFPRRSVDAGLHIERSSERPLSLAMTSWPQRIRPRRVTRHRADRLPLRRNDPRLGQWGSRAPAAFGTTAMHRRVINLSRFTWPCQSVCKPRLGGRVYGQRIISKVAVPH
jgi:hypothetical protein